MSRRQGALVFLAFARAAIFVHIRTYVQPADAVSTVLLHPSTHQLGPLRRSQLQFTLLESLIAAEEEQGKEEQGKEEGKAEDEKGNETGEGGAEAKQPFDPLTGRIIGTPLAADPTHPPPPSHKPTPAPSSAPTQPSTSPPLAWLAPGSAWLALGLLPERTSESSSPCLQLYIVCPCPSHRVRKPPPSMLQQCVPWVNRTLLPDDDPDST